MNRLLVIILSAGLILGCGKTQDDSKAPGKSADGNSKKKYRLAVIPKGTTHVFWKSVHAGAQKAADELGNVEILWQGPVLENDTDGQISVVQNFVTKQVDGIVLAPNDSRGLVACVQNAKSSGIPTVIFDSGLDTSESDYVSYVATDNYQGGAAAARRLAEALGNSGKVAMLRYKAGSESTEQREKGFLDTLTKEFPEIQIVSSDQYAGQSPEESLTSAQQLLLALNNGVDGMFAVCEPNSVGVLGALEGESLVPQVKFVAFDPNPRLVEALKEGKISGIVLQDPVRMGYDAVKILVDHLQGKTVERRVNTGEYVATPENMETEQFRRLLNPIQFED